MAERQRHFFLVHGAGHGAWCWYNVATLLKSAGHKVTALDLASCGVHPKRAHEPQPFSDYLQPLIELMNSLSPEERVILVSYSMGGLCISVAMERFPEKISAGVFVTSFMPGPDLCYTAVREKTLIDWKYLLLRAMQLDGSVDSYMDTQHSFVDGPDNPPTSMVFGPNFLSTKLYQLSPAEDLRLATLLVRPIRLHGDDVMEDVLAVTKEKYGSVRRVYVVRDGDNIIKEVQRWMIENNPTDEVKVISGSDHMPMFSKPQELCQCLQEVAEKYS